MSSPSTAPPSIPGHEYVRYLSSGGFGDVFVYRDNIGREVAIKVLHQSSLSPELQAEFQTEAARMAGVRSRYIVTVYGYGISDDGRPYISMEYCEGSLSEVVGRGAVSVADCLGYTIKVCSAIDAAHAVDLFHRDVKPANVLLSQDGQPALTDFGIAGGRQGGDASRGMSLRYSAPEVIGGVSDGDERADVYSAAATLYYLLVGRAPFDIPGGDNSAGALEARALRGSPPPTGRSDVPPSVERILARGLAREPSMRFASAEGFARALQEVEIELGYPPTTVPFANDRQQLGEVAPVTRPVDDDEATRFGGPVRVSPQPTSPAAPPSGPVSFNDHDGRTDERPKPAHPDRTQIRPGDRPAPPPSPTPDEVEVATDQDSTRTRTLTIASLVVIAAFVGLMVVLSGGGGGDGPEAVETPSFVDAGPDLFAQPSTPANVEIERGDDGVLVSWDPDPLDGVTYVVSITAGPLEGESFATPETSELVADDDPTAQVCARVLAVRDSATSEPAREVCTR